MALDPSRLAPRLRAESGVFGRSLTCCGVASGIALSTVLLLPFAAHADSLSDRNAVRHTTVASASSCSVQDPAGDASLVLGITDLVLGVGGFTIGVFSLDGASVQARFDGILLATAAAEIGTYGFATAWSQSVERRRWWVACHEAHGWPRRIAPGRPSTRAEDSTTRSWQPYFIFLSSIGVAALVTGVSLEATANAPSNARILVDGMVGGAGVATLEIAGSLGLLSWGLTGRSRAAGRRIGLSGGSIPSLHGTAGLLIMTMSY